MSYGDIERLYNLLPAIYRIRDAENGEPLKALLSVIAEQVAAVEENLDQLLDDQFAETCADWVVPYIGDLVGVRDLKGDGPRILSPRAVVANTIGYRRRKGTAAVLEQLARDVTGWDARAVEFFELLETTQHTNHVRLHNLRTPDLRSWEPLERLETAFDTVAHTPDVRSIARERGRHNISSIGIFLWRLERQTLTHSTAFKVDGRRYTFSPVGLDMPLFNRQQTEGSMAHITQPRNVSMPISRRVLREYLDDYYGRGESIFILVNGTGKEPQPGQRLSDIIEVRALTDRTDSHGNVTGWAHVPKATERKIAIDPVLGRIAFPRDQGDAKISVSFHYGFSANIGSGEYDRADTLDTLSDRVYRVPEDYPTIQEALDEASDGGVVEITDSRTYSEALEIEVADGQCIEVRSADGCRPTLVVGDLSAPQEILITGGEDSKVTLNGLLIAGAKLRVNAEKGAFRLRHCTLVPGVIPGARHTSLNPASPSLIVGTRNTEIEICRSIVGGLRVVDGASIRINHSIVDSTAESGVAYSALNEKGAGGTLRIENSTVIGRVHAVAIEMASNTIFLSRLPVPDKDGWLYPVKADRRQEGCVRFSCLPHESRVPRKYRCHLMKDYTLAGLRPMFTSLLYGDPGYCQLSRNCLAAVRHGADDESEIGAFHDLYQPQREANLRARLDEYLRFGLEVGIFYAT